MATPFLSMNKNTIDFTLQEALDAMASRFLAYMINCNATITQPPHSNKYAFRATIAKIFAGIFTILAAYKTLPDGIAQVMVSLLLGTQKYQQANSSSHINPDVRVLHNGKIIAQS